VVLPDPVPDEPLRDTETHGGEEVPRRALPSVIGVTVVMKGELIVGEDLVIEGTFDGTITGKGPDTVTVRRTAHLSGEVSAGTVRVEDGTNLEGTVISGRIKLAE
jgi:cytoskeletal protein CcmA (bactofilin family)